MVGTVRTAVIFILSLYLAFYLVMASPVKKVKTKRRKRLTLETKLAVYQKIKEGFQPSLIASEFMISMSTISEIKHYSGTFIQELLNANPRLHTKKTIRGYLNLDKQLLEFFNRQRSLGKPISSALLYEEANSVHGGLCDGTVSLSEGFMKEFLNRYNINKIRCLGEKSSADTDVVESFLQRFKQLTQGMTRDQIYNADEMGLFWRAIPSKRLAGPNEIECVWLQN